MAKIIKRAYRKRNTVEKLACECVVCGLCCCGTGNNKVTACNTQSLWAGVSAKSTK